MRSIIPLSVQNLLPSNDQKTLPIPICNDAVSVYVYDWPARFNLGMLSRCQQLNIYTNMCPHVANRGLGQLLPDHSTSWLFTRQFIAEIIFHARVENHPCRTWQPNRANLFYVPLLSRALRIEHVPRVQSHYPRRLGR
ncbi:hypothetical protein L6164_001042 [Bauhinia variegata]|uniref:Uncharacterized protein n=1 Tax=Bauhinia variegata TaxID=167791 RepID=A0ACB9Q9Q0_BAUVA|nr:hypothetical protein L6164_001042 [Bauhinia variegata]